MSVYFFLNNKLTKHEMYDQAEAYQTVTAMTQVDRVAAQEKPTYSISPDLEEVRNRYLPNPSPLDDYRSPDHSTHVSPELVLTRRLEDHDRMHRRQQTDTCTAKQGHWAPAW